MEIKEGTFDGVLNFLVRRWQHFHGHLGGYFAWAVVITVLVFGIATCQPVVKYSHLYVAGDMVCMKLNEQRTQVIDKMDYDSKIEVRYAASIVVVDDGVSTATQGYKKMWVHEYEVKSCE